MPVRSSKADPDAERDDQQGDNPLRRMLAAGSNIELKDPHLCQPRSQDPDLSRTLLVDPDRNEESARK
jgi:hypothetical protein